MFEILTTRKLTTSLVLNNWALTTGPLKREAELFPLVRFSFTFLPLGEWVLSGEATLPFSLLTPI